MPALLFLTRPEKYFILLACFHIVPQSHGQVSLHFLVITDSFEFTHMVVTIIKDRYVQKWHQRHQFPTKPQTVLKRCGSPKWDKNTHYPQSRPLVHTSLTIPHVWPSHVLGGGQGQTRKQLASQRSSERIVQHRFAFVVEGSLIKTVRV